MTEEQIDIIKDDSRFLYAEDLVKDGQPCEFRLTIKQVDDIGTMKGNDGKVIDRWPVHFEQTDKVWLMNKTNKRLVVSILQTKSRSEMAGKNITLYPAMLAKCFGQRNVRCIRVRVPDGVSAPFIKPDILGRDLTKG